MQSTKGVSLDRSEIATLSRSHIQAMEDAEMVTIVRAANLPFLTAIDVARLPQLGRDSLLSLGFMALRFCRNREHQNRWSALSE